MNESITLDKRVHVKQAIKDLIELSFEAPGENDEEHDAMAMATKIQWEVIRDANPGVSFKVLVDLTNAGIPSKEARDIYIKLMSDKQIGKIALFGLGGAIRSIIDFLVSASGKGEHIDFFVNKEKALDWLNN